VNTTIECSGAEQRTPVVMCIGGASTHERPDIRICVVVAQRPDGKKRIRGEFTLWRRHAERSPVRNVTATLDKEKEVHRHYWIICNGKGLGYKGFSPAIIGFYRQWGVHSSLDFLSLRTTENVGFSVCNCLLSLYVCRDSETCLVCLLARME
jgi:hypothetical protein